MLALVPAEGCVRLGFDPPDQAVSADARSGLPLSTVDAATDGPYDSTTPDRDGSPDLPVQPDLADAIADGHIPIRPDLSDTGVDQLQQVDSGPINACALGPLVFTYPGGEMAICHDATGGSGQCFAASMCDISGGWHLCSASEYQQRGGAAIGTSWNAWIASCIRISGSMVAPTETVCEWCSVVGSTWTTTDWVCGTGQSAATHSNGYLGLWTHDSCRRVGTNDPNNEAYWQAAHPGVNLAYAVCCN